MSELYADAAVTVDLLADLGPYGNNAYIVRPRAAGAAATLIDVPAGFEAVLAALDGAPVERVVVTHSHGDHWGGFEVMRAALDASVLAGAEETDIDPERAVERLADGEEVAVGEASMRVIHTPGHTPGSICLLLGGALFSGDTLFPGGPGASRSNAALQEEIASITSRLYPLPEETLVLPGHGPATTIGSPSGSTRSSPRSSTTRSCTATFFGSSPELPTTGDGPTARSSIRSAGVAAAVDAERPGREHAHKPPHEPPSEGAA